jgi:hypothetical protein
MIYVPLAGLGLPHSLVAALTKWLRGWRLLAALVLAGIAAVLFLAAVGPWPPSGMTDCRALGAPPPQVRYARVSTSSDDASYRHEFILEGWSSLPAMRLVSRKQ